MGPRIVRGDSNTTDGAALKRKKQAVIAARTAGGYFRYIAKILSRLRILQSQPSALFGVARRRARCVGDSIEGAWPRSEKNSGVELLNGPQMSAAASQIT